MFFWKGVTERVEMRLERKVALITGGYGGMGRASARLFAKEGATVFVAAGQVGNERFHHMLSLLTMKETHEKKEEVQEFLERRL